MQLQQLHQQQQPALSMPVAMPSMPMPSMASTMPPPPSPPRDAAPFLKSLRRMLDAEPREVLRWTPDGRAFEIHDMERMAAAVLPKYFKHCKYTSFQRQLNYFSFRKWTKSKAVVCTFSNDFFLRDRPELACRITRKKSAHANNHHHPHLAGPRHARQPLLPFARRPLPPPPQSQQQQQQQQQSQSTAMVPAPLFWRRADDPHRSPAHGFNNHSGNYSNHSSVYNNHNYAALTISAGPATAEPLDWMIDCLLPPPERADEPPYACYMYAPGSAGIGGGPGPTPGAHAAADPAKFEYVVM